MRQETSSSGHVESTCCGHVIEQHRTGCGICGCPERFTIRDIQRIRRDNGLPAEWRETIPRRPRVKAVPATPNMDAWRARQATASTGPSHRRLVAAASAADAALGGNSGTYLNRGEEWFDTALAALSRLDATAPRPR